MDIEILGEILKGGADKVKESGAVVIGGHSIIDEEIKFGMAVTGVIHPDKIFRNVGVQEGDVLILTKPLGTGIITTALKKGKARPESVNAAVKSMTTLNAAASTVARKHPRPRLLRCHRLRHPRPRAGNGQRQWRHPGLRIAKIPAAPSAVRLAEKGYITGGCKRNREYLDEKMAIDKGSAKAHRNRPRSADLRRAADRDRQAGRAKLSTTCTTPVSPTPPRSATPPRCRKPGCVWSDRSSRKYS